eukprot:TRINITY_DN2887_c0_g1_i1.p1 TRINITY_DN2887_c0_g1~~TRINITY_DN2887_c0_g1_i1.p1  ORF type:complete len:208 (+),score=92.19 TRINITY_DN2887_c0_g1_i1:383-1006(+)
MTSIFRRSGDQTAKEIPRSASFSESDKELEELKKKVLELTKWKANHETIIDAIRDQIKNTHEGCDRDRKQNEEMEKELIQVKKQLEEDEKELETLQNRGSTSPKTASGESGELEKSGSSGSPEKGNAARDPGDAAKYRSWNRKVVGNYQDLILQINSEKNSIIQLQAFKAENEPKYEELKTTLREAADSRLKLEEDILRLERELKKK